MFLTFCHVLRKKRVMQNVITLVTLELNDSNLMDEWKKM